MKKWEQAVGDDSVRPGPIWCRTVPKEQTMAWIAIWIPLMAVGVAVATVPLVLPPTISTNTDTMGRIAIDRQSKAPHPSQLQT